MLKLDKWKYCIDLLVILLTYFVVFGIIGIFYMVLKIDTRDFPLLVQTIIGSLFQFGSMGLGITFVCMWRKESYCSFGLKADKFLMTILLSAAICLPTLFYLYINNEVHSYFPLQNVNFTKDILASSFPINLVGIVFIVVSWGFFEGFSYVVMSDRINKLFPSKSFWLDWGAIICGGFCITTHLIVGIIGVSSLYANVFDALIDFILIYGMLLVYKYTGNAWGCVFIFCFYWNAIS